jgi:hypothetical protein
MSIKMGTHALLLAASFAPVVCALADNADTANKSNNPLNLAPGANLQDYYTPKLFDSNAYTNDALLRGTLPIRYFPAQDRGRAAGHRSANYRAHRRTGRVGHR